MHNRFSSWLGSALAAVATLALLIIAYGATPAVTQAVGAQDTLVFRNVLALETAGDLTFRWSGGDTRLELPQIGQPALGLIQIHLGVQDSQPPTSVTLRTPTAPLATVAPRGQRLLRLIVPGHAVPGGNLELGVASPTWSPPGDPRQLGVMLKQLDWQPLGRSSPPIRQLWVLPSLVIALAGLLLRLGRASWMAHGIALAVGGGLALGAALRPLEVAPYTHRLLLIVLLAHVALLVWSALTREDRRWWQLPPRVMPPALIVLLGVGYWMCLIFQWALALETTRSVWPRPGTYIIGSIVLVLLGMLALLPTRLASLRRRGALAALAISGLAEAAYAAAFSFRRSGPDFFILWRAAYDFSLGRPLYRIEDVLANHFGHVFKVPPFYGMLFLPIANASDAVYNVALTLHRSLNIVLYLVTGGLLAYLLRVELRRRDWLPVAAVAVIMGLMQPPFDTIAYGQIDIVLLLLLTLALIGLRTQRSWLVGLGIALGGLFKLYPILLLGLLFVRRDWRSMAWTFGWLALLNSIAIGVMGWDNHVMYVTQVLPNIGGGTSWVENQTINGFLSRLITGTMETNPIRDRTINMLTYGSFALVAGASFLLALAPAERRSNVFALQFSIFAVVMVLAVPAAWMHYSTITILAFTLLVWRAAEHPLSVAQAATLALAFALIAYGNQWSYFDGTRHLGLPALALSYKFYGLALLWSLLAQAIWQAWALRRQAPVQAPAVLHPA